MPINTQRTITIARDSSNFHVRKETDTVAAFWAEKRATIAIIINVNIIVIIWCISAPYPLFGWYLLPFLKLLYLFFKFFDSGYNFLYITGK